MELKTVYRRVLIKRIDGREVWVQERLFNSIITIGPPGLGHDDQW